MLLIFDPTGVGREDSETPAHGARGPSHIAFAVAERDLPAWQQHLHAHRVEIEKTVDWPQGGCSIYFRDPAGNSLELATPQIWNGVHGSARTTTRGHGRVSRAEAADALQFGRG